jgi:DNA-binding MarR family transcriptional regulator
MPAHTYGVLIADVVASSSTPNLRALLGKKLTLVSNRHLKKQLIDLPYSVTAGDEFQTLTESLHSIPSIILDLRIKLRPLAVRIGIGFGTVSDRIKAPVNRLSGEAFQNARKAIETLDTHSRVKFEVLTAFKSPDEDFNETVNLIYGLHDTLVLKIKPKQWQAIEEFMEKATLEKTARELSLDTSTISRHLKRGYYWQLVETARVAGSFIQRSFS